MSFQNTMTSDMLRASVAVPQTSFAGADATMLNTVMEASVPGFLRLTYDVDVKVQGRLTAGGAGTIFRAKLLKPDAIRRHGVDDCAVKELRDVPSLTEAENLERFQQEVSVMWSLSFNANVISLIGYCENPRVIVTRLYPTDLFRFLHAQEDKSQLEQHMLLHLCAGMAAATAAVHSMGVAHRDIKSPNFLLQEPKSGSPFPDAIMCDFGLARTPEDNPSALKVKGLSPRYAPPEVFARAHLRFVSHPIEEDKMSDVYSLGVVLWETTTRMIPWDGIDADDIAFHVRAGARVPALEVDPGDVILMVVNDIINMALQATPQDRPTAVAVNTMFASFIKELQNA